MQQLFAWATHFILYHGSFKNNFSKSPSIVEIVWFLMKNSQAGYVILFICRSIINQTLLFPLLREDTINKTEGKRFEFYTFSFTTLNLCCAWMHFISILSSTLSQRKIAHADFKKTSKKCVWVEMMDIWSLLTDSGPQKYLDALVWCSFFLLLSFFKSFGLSIKFPSLSGRKNIHSKLRSF